MKKLLKKLLLNNGLQISKTPYGDAYSTLRHLKKDVASPVIFDVGAYHGEISMKFRELFPTAKIYSFEPFAPTYAKLTEKCGSDEGIKCFEFALSESDSRSKLQANKGKATNSLLETDARAAETWGEGVLETEQTVSIETRTLDSVVSENGIEKIDILKLDVQGAEHLVMKGAAEVCEKGLVDFIYSEVILQPSYEGQLRFDKALSVFYDRGFELVNLFDLSVTDDGTLRQVDGLFRRKS